MKHAWFQKHPGAAGLAVAMMVVALTGQGCPLLGGTPPELPPLTGSREEVEKGIKDVVPVEMEATVDLIFKHTKPGSYSDLFAMIQSLPNADIMAQWKGPCLDPNPTTSGKTDAKGSLELTQRFRCFGKYEIMGTATKDGKSASFDKTVDVK